MHWPASPTLWTILFLTLSLADLTAAPLGQVPEPRAVLPEQTLDFGVVRQGEEVVRNLILDNYGDGVLVVEEVTTSVPELEVRLEGRVPAGGTKTISFRLRTGQLSGSVTGEVILLTNDPRSPRLRLEVRGQVQVPVQVLPRPLLAISAFRSQTEQVSRSLTLTGGGPEDPLKILGIDAAQERYRLELKALEEGQRYRLTARLRPEAPPGQAEEWITVRTNRGEVPILVMTFLKTKVYAAPPQVDFGLIDRAQIEQDPGLKELLPKIFHLYRRGSEPFSVKIQSSLPFLTVDRTPAEGSGAVVHIPGQGNTSIFDLTVQPILAQLKPGSFQGVIRLFTNDPDFPEVTVPVQGEVR